MTWVDPALRPRRRKWAGWVQFQMSAGQPCARCGLDLVGFTYRYTFVLNAWLHTPPADRLWLIFRYPQLRHTLRVMGFEPDSSFAVADHVVPLWEGGADDEANLQLLCGACHKPKTREEAHRRARVPKKRFAS